MTEILRTDRVFPRLKPEIRARVEAIQPFQIRMRTPAEQDAYAREREEKERERTKGWPVCLCCERPKPQGDYLLKDILVCCDCADRGQRYGRPWRRRERVPQTANTGWYINVAMAVIKELERECRNRHNNHQPESLTMAFPPTLTLPISQKP